MKKRLALLSVFAMAFASANALMDLELAGGGNLYTVNRSSVLSYDTKADTAADADAVWADATATVTRSVSGFTMDSFGAALRADFDLMGSGAYLGAHIGFQYDMAMAVVAGGKNKKTVYSKRKDATFEDVTVAEEDLEAADAQTGTAYSLIPIMVNFKYDIAQPVDNLNIYFTGRAGTSYALAGNAKAVKTPGVVTAEGKDEHTVNAFDILGNLAWGVGAGVEYYGAQLELGVSSYSAGTTAHAEETATPADSHVTKTDAAHKAYDHGDGAIVSNAKTVYSNMGLYATIGYRFRDLF